MMKINQRLLETMMSIVASVVALQADPVTMETPDNEKLEVEWIVDEDFRDDGWQERWFVESQGPQVSVGDGRLKIRLVDDNRKEAGVTVWWKEELPENIIIDVSASTDAVVENNACNLNFFIHAREADGSLLSFGREGIYKEYHELPNHLITFTGGITPGWSRARLNPGFHLIHESANHRAEPGQDYRFLIIINGDHVRYYINGEKVHDYHVDSALPGGRFGLRTWFSSVNYESVKIGEIVESKH